MKKVFYFLFLLSILLASSVSCAQVEAFGEADDTSNAVSKAFKEMMKYCAVEPDWQKCADTFFPSATIITTGFNDDPEIFDELFRRSSPTEEIKKQNKIVQGSWILQQNQIVKMTPVLFSNYSAVSQSQGIFLVTLYYVPPSIDEFDTHGVPIVIEDNSPDKTSGFQTAVSNGNSKFSFNSPTSGQFDGLKQDPYRDSNFDIPSSQIIDQLKFNSKLEDVNEIYSYVMKLRRLGTSHNTHSRSEGLEKRPLSPGQGGKLPVDLHSVKEVKSEGLERNQDSTNSDNKGNQFGDDDDGSNVVNSGNDSNQIHELEKFVAKGMVSQLLARSAGFYIEVLDGKISYLDGIPPVMRHAGENSLGDPDSFAEMVPPMADYWSNLENRPCLSWLSFDFKTKNGIATLGVEKKHAHHIVGRKGVQEVQNLKSVTPEHFVSDCEQSDRDLFLEAINSVSRTAIHRSSHVLTYFQLTPDGTEIRKMVNLEAAGYSGFLDLDEAAAFPCAIDQSRDRFSSLSPTVLLLFGSVASVSILVLFCCIKNRKALMEMVGLSERRGTPIEPLLV